MATTRAALTAADIQVLVRSADEDERAVVAHRLCRRIDAGLSDEERDAAHAILRLMAADAAELVRRALAVTLKTSPELPRDVALRLARDVESIAAPVLNFSPAFTDADLVEIVRADNAAKQLAVARRGALSEAVTDALGAHGGEEAVRIAIANDNAAFSERTLRGVVERFADRRDVAEVMAYRRTLPLSVSERLVELVSERVRQHLVDHHQLSPETALAVALGARERATLDLVDQAGRAPDLKAFCGHLRRSGRLTASLLLRALAHGHAAFVEWGLAELADTPHHRAWLMIHDAGPLGLKAVYERAALPPRLFAAFRAGVDALHALEAEGGAWSARQLQERMLQRFLTQPSGAGREDTDYLMDKMDRAASPRLMKAG